MTKHSTLIVLMLLPVAALAQSGRLTLVTVPGRAEAFLDTAYVGRTPVERLEVPEGLHRIRLFTPSSRDWNALARIETVHVAAGEEVVKTIELGTTFSVHSVPSGAAVVLNGVELGTTPLFHRTTKTVRGELVIRKEGYTPEAIEAFFPGRTVILKPIEDGPAEVAEVAIQPADDSRFRQWATYSSAAAMIVSGVFAAYYKDKANRRFDTYLSTNDPLALASTERNDRRSAIALIVTQISFGVLTYLLLSD